MLLLSQSPPDIVCHWYAMSSIKTQGSTKVFKCLPASEGCSQHITATVAKDALLVLVPDPVTCFDDSKYQQIMIFKLHADASLVVVDWLTSGRKVYKPALQ